MRRAFAFAASLLTLAGQARAEGWNCSAAAELSPNLPAMMETLLGADRSRTTLDFYIWWVPQPRYIANQSMSWIGIPREATLLWKPDRIEFGVPGTRTDNEGYIQFESLRGNAFYSVIRPASVRSLRPTFQTNWVVIEDGAVIAQLWARPPGRVRYTDRRGEELGSLEILLPAAADAQAVFTRMRAELERKATDPQTHCRALPDEPQDQAHP